jgi:translocation and assembly module TamB
VGVLFVYISSPAFEEQARKYIIEEIRRRTGAEVSLGTFNANLWAQRFRLEDLTLRGLEPAGEAPLAHFDRISVGISFRSLFERHIDLFELTLERPAFHVIVGPDGRTNIPSPQQGERSPVNFQISIENFDIVDGMAILNDRPVDLEFSLNNLQSMLSYHSAREALQAHISYDYHTHWQRTSITRAQHFWPIKSS